MKHILYADIDDDADRVSMSIVRIFADMETYLEDVSADKQVAAAGVEPDLPRLEDTVSDARCVTPALPAETARAKDVFATTDAKHTSKKKPGKRRRRAKAAPSDSTCD